LFGCNCDEECRPYCNVDDDRKKRSPNEDDPRSKFAALDIDADGLISVEEAHSHFSLQKRDTEVTKTLKDY